MPAVRRATRAGRGAFPLCDGLLGAVGPVSEHEGVMREEVEDERAYVDLVLERRGAGEVLGSDDATDLEDRVGVGTNLLERDRELLREC